MRQLTVFCLALGVLGLLGASIQAQPNPAIVTKGGTVIGAVFVNEETGLVSASFTDLNDLFCWAGCADCVADQLAEEEIRLHAVETFSSNFNTSINGPVYTFVATNIDTARICLNLGWGIADFSLTIKNHGENRLRMTIGGFLDTLPFLCPSRTIDFNVVFNHKGMKGPHAECVEPD
jgi:hypothetical protein